MIFEAINSFFLGGKKGEICHLSFCPYILQVQAPKCSTLVYNLSKETRASAVNIFNYYKGGASSCSTGSTNSCTSCLFPPHSIQSRILCPCLVSHAGCTRTQKQKTTHAPLFKTQISETEASGISFFFFIPLSPGHLLPQTSSNLSFSPQWSRSSGDVRSSLVQLNFKEARRPR